MSIRKQRSGRFAADIPHPTRPGQVVRAPTTFRTRTEARNWVSATKSAIANGTWKSPEELARELAKAEAQAARDAFTFGQYVPDYLATRSRWKPSTRRNAEKVINRHLLPYWQDVPLKDIDRAALSEWLAHISTLTPGAWKKAAEHFRAIMRQALEDERITALPWGPRTFANAKPEPAEDRRQHDGRALTADEVRAIAAELPDYMRLLFTLSAFTGLRSGEARELRGKDVSQDMAGRVLVSVARGVTGQGKDIKVTTPKTAKSIRTVIVPEALAGVVTRRAREAGPEGLLFHALDRPETHLPARTYQLAIGRAVDRAGLESVSPHDLRRTFASLAIQSGATARATADLLGHTKTTMTERYTFAYSEDMARIADAMDAAITGHAPEVADLDERRRQA